MVSQSRAMRIADRIREGLSELLLREAHDPRLAGISVTDVRVDRELAYANIYISALEGSSRAAEIIAGLEHAQGFLRTELARRSNLRVFPRLRFYWDATFERAERIEALIASLRTESAEATPAQTDEDTADE